MNNIPNYLEPLIAAVPHNATLRFNCPKCRGFNTLGITKESGKVKYHCFKASCNLKPNSFKYSRSVSELKTSLQPHTELKEGFKLPEHLIYGLGSKKTIQMIMQGNCLEPYKLGLFDTAYDPIQDRVCFIIKKGNEISGLIGKSCSKATQPKVYNYGDTEYPFIVGQGNILVLVEDCLSAASVTRLQGISGMALLGSSLKVEYIPIVKTYTKIIVALDRDARKKALAIKRKLCYYHSNVQMWLLNEDIKDMSDVKLKESFNL